MNYLQQLQDASSVINIEAALILAAAALLTGCRTLQEDRKKSVSGLDFALIGYNLQRTIEKERFLWG